jgi:predicted nucleic acid-binding protein
MNYLLDTNIISELRKPRPHPGLISWFEAQASSALFLSVITLGEIRQGVEQLRSRDAKQAELIDRWLQGLLHFYEDRLVYVDGDIAEDWGRIRARKTVPVMDAFVAATARVHGMTLVTRNARDFAGLGVTLLNPFQV